MSKIDCAKDAVADAIENRRESKLPKDKGLDYAMELLYEIKPITEHPDVQRIIIQVETLGQENKKLKEAIEKVLPGISRAMGNYEEARYIEISVLYDALKGNER